MLYIRVPCPPSLLTCMILHFFPHISQEVLAIASKKANHSFLSAICTRSIHQDGESGGTIVHSFRSRIQHPESEHKGLSQMMTAMMGRVKSNPSQPVFYDSGFRPSFPKQESLHRQVQSILNLSVQFHISQQIPILEHVEIPIQRRAIRSDRQRNKRKGGRAGEIVEKMKGSNSLATPTSVTCIYI